MKCLPCLERPDILGAGLPCQPLSSARQRNGDTKKTKEAEAHPLWSVSMRDFARLLRARMPHMFIVEEVEGFTKAMDALDGLSPAQALKAMVKVLGYGCTAILLDHRVFTAMARPRVWIIGVHRDSGGQEAADAIVAKIDAAMHQLSALNALNEIKFSDIVDLESDAEKQRRSKLERAFFLLFVHIFIQTLPRILPAPASPTTMAKPEMARLARPPARRQPANPPASQPARPPACPPPASL